MSSYAKKLIYAAFLSATGIILSLAWYRYEEKSFTGSIGNKKKIARIDSTKK